jgi:hypothetical protein
MVYDVIVVTPVDGRVAVPVPATHVGITSKLILHQHADLSATIQVLCRLRERTADAAEHAGGHAPQIVGVRSIEQQCPFAGIKPTIAHISP